MPISSASIVSTRRDTGDNGASVRSTMGPGEAGPHGNPEGQAWILPPSVPDLPEDAQGQVPRWCGAGNKWNIMTTTPVAAMRGSMLALPIGKQSCWALYPTPLSAGGDVERDGLGHPINEPHGVGCQSLLCGDCWWPEKVVKGIYITFCIRPWSHKEMCIAPR